MCNARSDDAKVAVRLPLLRPLLRPAVFHTDGNRFDSKAILRVRSARENLCPKGAASYQLLTHSRRERKMNIVRRRAKE